MARYQIRTPENMVLEDVIVQMSKQVTEVLQAWKFFQVPSHEEWEHLATGVIREYFHLYVKSYRLCGISNICLDHLKTTPWSPESHVLDATPRDMIYQLLPRTELNGFLDELVTRFYHSVRMYLKPGNEEEILSTLSVVMQNVLASYLYYNPLCGLTELCTYSAVSRRAPAWMKRDGRKQSKVL
jgi:hypothetical protein